ncbi:MAG: peptide deformylase, partial [Pseudomonadota bacterium]
MAIIAILQYPDPRLKRIATPITKEQLATLSTNAKIQKIIDDMFETCFSAENCAALAATQLDLLTPYAITVLNLGGEYEPMCLINPTITESSGEQHESEGCMSVMPNKGISARVTRAQSVVVEGYDRAGRPIRVCAEGYEAKAFQHEIDHLNGKTYLDRLPVEKREMVLKRMKEIEKAR